MICVLVFLAGCNAGIIGSGYECPDRASLSYDNSTDMYVEWKDCMPPAGDDCDVVDADREKWVEEHCGFNYTVRVAY